MLIPKVENPTSMKDLRHISLCNVMYKILAKVLANRLKGILPIIIYAEQLAFVLGRSIIDNVVVAFELIHSLRQKCTGKKRGCCFKDRHQ